MIQSSHHGNLEFRRCPAKPVREDETRFKFYTLLSDDLNGKHFTTFASSITSFWLCYNNMLTQADSFTLSFSLGNKYTPETRNEGKKGVMELLNDLQGQEIKSKENR